MATICRSLFVWTAARIATCAFNSRPAVCSSRMISNHLESNRCPAIHGHSAKFTVCKRNQVVRSLTGSPSANYSLWIQAYESQSIGHFWAKKWSANRCHVCARRFVHNFSFRFRMQFACWLSHMIRTLLCHSCVVCISSSVVCIWSLHRTIRKRWKAFSA